MKTIFFTIFEGVEGKNILRTGIIDKLLDKDTNIRIVLFTKNKERAEYYQKEFHNPRIIYEVIDTYKPNFLDRLFGRLKYNFLQTETTDLRAKMVAEERGILYYYYSLILHRILGRSYFIKIFRFLEIKLVKCELFDRYFEKYKPNVILLANLFEDIEVNFLRSAKKYKTTSVGLINSWDRVTARCILRLMPDHLIVFNNALQTELVETNNANISNIFVSGLPQYDTYFASQKIPDQQQKLVVYSPIGGMFSNSDWEIIDLLYKLNADGKFDDNVSILVRFPPNDFIKDEDLKKRPYLKYQYPGVRFSSFRSQDWDMTALELKELEETLRKMSMMICYASSISIDAAVFDKPVINIDFEVKNNDKLSKSPTTFYKMAHYKKAISTGGIKLVKSEQELISCVNKYLEDPDLDKEGRKLLVLQQCTYTDGHSAERIADHLSKLLLT